MEKEEKMARKGKAFVLAAGLGTRLRPWTLSHPKALVPVGGIPMLGRVLGRVRESGFGSIVVNVHHFASQIYDFLSASPEYSDVAVSDESAELLDTGGALLHALPLLRDGEQGDVPVLVHNVDILSNAPLELLLRRHEESGAAATLLVSDRDSSRRLLFDSGMHLRGWHNIASGEYRPACVGDDKSLVQYAFSGIYVIETSLIARMPSYGYEGKFSIIDFLLDVAGQEDIRGELASDLRLIDIGKPATLERACEIYGTKADVDSL